MTWITGKAVTIGCLLALSASLANSSGAADEVAGVTARIEGGEETATLHLEPAERFEVKIHLDSKIDNIPLVVHVELPISGRHAWPIADVEVLDSNRRPVAVRRSGTQWHKLSFTVPAARSTFIVHAVKAPDDRMHLPSEKERHATDSKTGLSATICKWHAGRRAALSLRFDDSHPTHLSTAIPILDDYGFRGTFMVNPGGHLPNSRRRSAFEDHREEWEAVARSGRHEFANHTLHHRGATCDEEMEHEIGDAAKAIWKLCPHRSKLAALNLGGGTQWVTTKTLRYYLDKYDLFDASSNSTGMDDSYGDRITTFRRLLEAHIKRGLWYKVHYHSIGDGFSTSEGNFRAALDIAKEHQDELWIAGMADIYKYQTERQGARLAVENRGPTRVALQLSCSTNPTLYDQALTIEVALPPAWPANRVVVKNAKGMTITTTTRESNGQALLLFDVSPRAGRFLIERLP